MSVNSHQSYNTGLLAFEHFRRTNGLESLWPPTADQVVSFVGFLSLKGLAATTARSYVSSIGYHCKLLGVEDITQEFIIRKVIEGMKRLKHTKDSRLPITPVILSNIIKTLPVVCYNSYESSLFMAVYTLAFFGFFRVGELTLSKGGNSNNIVGIEDIEVKHKISIILKLRFSKTDQLGYGQTITIAATGENLCPVRYLEAFLEVRPRLKGPLFCHFGGAPLTRYQFSSMLQRVLRVLKVDYSRYKTHSFRIGAASAAAAAGHSAEVIQTAGRWKSNVYSSYIRAPVIAIPNIVY